MVSAVEVSPSPMEMEPLAFWAHAVEPPVGLLEPLVVLLAFSDLDVVDLCVVHLVFAHGVGERPLLLPYHHLTDHPLRATQQSPQLQPFRNPGCRVLSLNRVVMCHLRL